MGITRTIALSSLGSSKSLPILQVGLAIVTGALLADQIVLMLRSHMLPTQSPPVKALNLTDIHNPNRSEYASIANRNIFSFTGEIPAPKIVGRKQESEADPVPTQLPLTLIGTIVHSNPAKSIANVEVRGKNQALAFSPNREIDRLAVVVRVERNRLILRNLNNGRLEYLENKESGKLSFSAGKAQLRPEGPANLKIVGENRYEIPRSEILRFTSDMSNIVMQASTIPHRKPTGEIDGYQITSIAPGSLISQLGYLPSDVLKKVNGEPIDSPAKAIELYNALRNSNSVKVTVERDGREIEFDYIVPN